MKNEILISNELMQSNQEKTITVEHRNGSELVIVNTPAAVLRYMEMGYYKVTS